MNNLFNLSRRFTLVDNYRRPWILWWDETYCKNCEPIKVEFTEAEKATLNFDCACELTEDGIGSIFQNYHVPTSRNDWWLDKEKAGRTRSQELQKSRG